MPGVTVSVTNTGTDLARDTVTGADGAFVFPDLLAGTYDSRCPSLGSRPTSRRGCGSARPSGWPAEDRLDVGGLSEQVTVESRSVQVQTTNGARSGVIKRETMDDIALKGRDFAGLLKLLPGVIDTRP